MARAKFNREQVLENATNAFWRLGYNATSMQIISEETGLKPGSIYLAFGNKEGLFKQSLDYYNRRTLTKLSMRLPQYPTVEESIRHILIDFVDEASQLGHCSCFLVKSQLELSEHQNELRAFVALCLNKVERLFFTHLLINNNNTQAQAQAQAASLMLHIYGIRVYGCHSQTPQRVLAALQLGLPWLAWPADNEPATSLQAAVGI